MRERKREGKKREREKERKRERERKEEREREKEREGKGERDREGEGKRDREGKRKIERKRGKKERVKKHGSSWILTVNMNRTVLWPIFINSQVCISGVCKGITWRHSCKYEWCLRSK